VNEEGMEKCFLKEGIPREDLNWKGAPYKILKKVRLTRVEWIKKNLAGYQSGKCHRSSILQRPS